MRGCAYTHRVWDLEILRKHLLYVARGGWKHTQTANTEGSGLPTEWARRPVPGAFWSD